MGLGEICDLVLYGGGVRVRWYGCVLGGWLVVVLDLLLEVCGVLHVFGGVVVGGWWCSVEPVLGQSGRAMNLGRGL